MLDRTKSDFKYNRSLDISLFPVVPAAPNGRFGSHLAKRRRTGAKTYPERRLRSERNGT